MIKTLLKKYKVIMTILIIISVISLITQKYIWNMKIVSWITFSGTVALSVIGTDKKEDQIKKRAIGIITILVYTVGLFAVGDVTGKTDVIATDITEKTIESELTPQTYNNPGQITEINKYQNADTIETEIKSGVVYTSTIDLSDLFWIDTYLQEKQIDKESNAKAYQMLKEEIAPLIGCKVEPSKTEINANVEVGLKTVQANELTISNLAPQEKLENLIQREQLRSEAYEVLAYGELARLIMLDNYEIGMCYLKKTNITPSDKDAVIRNGKRAIEYFKNALTYFKVDDERIGNSLYCIGQVYHMIGDIPYMDKEIRAKAFNMAQIYYKLSIEYGCTVYDFYNEYYYSMSNHKLGVLLDEMNYTFLMYAEDGYTECLNSSNKEDIVYKDINRSLKNIYYRLGEYIGQYGIKEGMLNQNEYEDKVESIEESYSLR